MYGEGGWFLIEECSYMVLLNKCREKSAEQSQTLAEDRTEGIAEEQNDETVEAEQEQTPQQEEEKVGLLFLFLIFLSLYLLVTHALRMPLYIFFYLNPLVINFVASILLGFIWYSDQVLETIDYFLESDLPSFLLPILAHDLSFVPQEQEHQAEDGRDHAGRCLTCLVGCVAETGTQCDSGCGGWPGEDVDSVGDELRVTQETPEPPSEELEDLIKEIRGEKKRKRPSRRDRLRSS